HLSCRDDHGAAARIESPCRGVGNSFFPTGRRFHPPRRKELNDMKDSAGHDLSGCTPRALDLLERGLHEFRCLMLDPVASVDAALAEAPELVMAHVLRGWLYALSTEAAAMPVVREAIDTA